MDQERIRIDDLKGYRARVAAGVVMVRDKSGVPRLHDCTGRGRTEEQMERDVAAAVLGRN